MEHYCWDICVQSMLCKRAPCKNIYSQIQQEWRHLPVEVTRGLLGVIRGITVDFTAKTQPIRGLGARGQVQLPAINHPTTTNWAINQVQESFWTMAESWFWHNNGSFWQHFKFRLWPPGRWTEISLDTSFKLMMAILMILAFWSLFSVCVVFTSQKSRHHWKGCWRDCSGLRKPARGRRSRRNGWNCPHHDFPNCHALTFSKKVEPQRIHGACELPSWTGL